MDNFEMAMQECDHVFTSMSLYPEDGICDMEIPARGFGTYVPKYEPTHGKSTGNIASWAEKFPEGTEFFCYREDRWMSMDEFVSEMEN